MALRELLAALEAEVGGEVAQAARAEQEQARSILAEGRASAERERARVIAELLAPAQDEAQLIAAQAGADARRMLARTRDDALQAVHDEALDRLADLPGTPRGAAVVRRCLDEALRALPSATTLSLHPEDVEAVGSPADPSGGLHVRADLTSGGAYATAADGSFIDNTLPTRLDNVWSTARIELIDRWGAGP